MTRLLPIAFVILGVVFFANAQEPVSNPQESRGLIFGIKGGVNLSAYNNLTDREQPKAGLSLGGYLKHQIRPNLFFRPEIYYSSQGQETDYYSGGYLISLKETLHYLNVPLLLELGRKLTIQGGAQIGLLLAARQKGTISGRQIDDSMKDALTTADLALVVGAGYSSKHFDGGVRFNYGVSNISPSKNLGPGYNIPETYNRVLHFYAAYTF